MNRLTQTFQNLKQQKKKAFVAFFTAGYPDLATTEQLVEQVPENGVDVIELGVPFSDPLADGPVIQATSEHAIKQGVNLPKIFDLVTRLRKKIQTPICLMTYFNPVFHYGEEKFIKDALKAGVDGVIIPDLPPEEAKDFIELSRKHDFATTFFLAPTTQDSRVKKIADASSGFIYYVSITGVTGSGQQLSESINKHLTQVKKKTDRPICVGFGVSTPEQVKQMTKVADGVIVGSAIIKEITKNLGKKDLVKKVSNFIKQLSNTLK